MTSDNSNNYDIVFSEEEGDFSIHLAYLSIPEKSTVIEGPNSNYKLLGEVEDSMDSFKKLNELEEIQTQVELLDKIESGKPAAIYDKETDEIYLREDLGEDEQYISELEDRFEKFSSQHPVFFG